MALVSVKQNNLNTDEFGFGNFAKTYFQGDVDGYLSKKPLKQSLLAHETDIDNTAAQVIWIIILRFMGDASEANYNSAVLDNGQIKSAPLTQLRNTIAKYFQSNNEHKPKIGPRNINLLQFTTKTGSLKQNSNVPPELLRNVAEIEYYQQMLTKPSSQLSKLQFIIGHGIHRPHLRNEIFAQLCKQLTNNPSSTSFVKGWLLLALCLHCFAPSLKYVNYLRRFIMNGPAESVYYYTHLLERTLLNGTRNQPPSLLEIEAAGKKKIISLNIHLMDGSTEKWQVDSATTAREALTQLAKHIGLVDTFGFSIVVLFEGFTMSLGSGNEHIFDAVSYCDQNTKESMNNSRDAERWQFYLRKELFCTYYDPSEDQLATHLIYKQIIEGLKTGEYRCTSHNDYAELYALMYYAEHGENLDSQLLSQLLAVNMTKDLKVSEDSTKAWEERVTVVLQNKKNSSSCVSRQQAKEEICLFARQKWSSLFSRKFEILQRAGPNLSSDCIVMTINTNGIYFLSTNNITLKQLTYSEVKICCALTHSHTNSMDNSSEELQIQTIASEVFVFKCFQSQDIAELINNMIRNLKIHQQAVEKINAHDPQLIPQVTYFKGDSKSALRTQGKRSLAHGKNVKFAENSLNSSTNFYKPTDHVMESNKSDFEKLKSSLVKALKFNTKRAYVHTLKNFAADNFRVVNRETETELWHHSMAPLREPLLKQLQDHEECFQYALVMYHHMLKYMGDIRREHLHGNTDLIFKPAMDFEILRDELYCQLMKQLTNNPSNASEEHGWDLMYLATGVIYPTSLVMKELKAFLESHEHVLAKHCLERLQCITESGPRLKPPYITEVECIQNRCMQIYHKIYFPDGTVEAFEIQSYTRAANLVQILTTRFALKSNQGYYLFIAIDHKTHSIPADAYIFDAISAAMQFHNQQMLKRSFEKTFHCPYQLHFKKKLWLKALSDDRNADIIFHYPQEVTKYLNGFYSPTFENALELASLVYISEYGNTTVGLLKVNNIVQQLLPADILVLKQNSEWKSLLKSAILKLNADNVDKVAAKQRFLYLLSTQATFASAFFVVKQTRDENLPKTLLMAINKDGLQLLDVDTKKLLQSFGYADLNSWNSGINFVELQFVSKTGWYKFLCNTTQAHEVVDLLAEYSKYFKECL